MSLHLTNKKDLTDFIVSKAIELGFFDCGISKAEHLPNNEIKMEEWLANGYNGEMGYLERNKDKRYNPQLLVENAKSVITVLYNYYPKKNLNQEGNFKISKYAFGIDYHYVIKNKLNELLELIKTKTASCNARVFVDSAPVLDRAWAQKGNLGFIGKNTMLINKKGGSFFFIGNIIIDIELDYVKQPDPKNYCGNCTQCIDACPTSAIKNNYVDAQRCLSYLTIEYNGELPQNEKENFSDWIFGCDICQDVCPWNRFSTPNNEELFIPSELLASMNKEKWQKMNKIDFNNLFKGSAVNRTRFKGLKRNIDFLSEHT